MSAGRLQRRALAGALWMSADRVLFFVVAAVVTVVLARLLPPSDFGVVGAALVVVEIAAQIVNAATTPALVQRPELSRQHLAAAFWISAGVSVTLFGIVWVVTPSVAAFFGIPALLTVLPCLAIVLVADGLSAVSRALQQRALAFREAVIVRSAADVVGLGVVSIAMAFGGYGVWALVGGRVAQSALRASGYLARFPHEIRGGTWGAAGEIGRFGAGIMAQGMLNSLARQGDSLVVGRVFGTRMLGLYNRAYDVMTMPASFLASTFNGVLFPVLSRTQHDPPTLEKALYRTTALCGIVLLPVSALTFVLAADIVLVVLGPGWVDAISILRVLAFGIFLRVAYKVGETLLRSRGRVFVAAVLQGVYAIAVLLGAWLGTAWGASGVAAAVVGAAGLYYVLVSATAARDIGARALPLFATLLPGLGLAVLCGGLAHLAVGPVRAAGLPPLVSLLVGSATASAAWGGVLAAAPGLVGESGAWLRAATVDALGRAVDRPGSDDSPSPRDTVT